MFKWNLFPKGEEHLYGKVRWFLKNHGWATGFAKKVEAGTSTRFFDWVDHMVLPERKVDKGRLEKLGFKKMDKADVEDATVYRNNGSVLFPLLLSDDDMVELAIKVEEMDNFRKVNLKGRRCRGARYSQYRKLTVKEQKGFRLTAVERRGYPGFVVRRSKDLKAYTGAFTRLRNRKRSFSTDEEGMAATRRLVKGMTRKLDEARVADAFFRAERIKWERRCKAGWVQKKRQDIFGLGWANHDHHAFRSSRKNYNSLISILETMGLRPRERFYAGAQAGWGAQVMEQSDCEIAVFADVDLGKEERSGDFAHKGLSTKEELGTIGLWVSLHGESILQAGIHHLAARFRFVDIRKALKRKGLGMMAPFSNFPYLKQAFTVGERWRPVKDRISDLLEHGHLTGKRYRSFREKGAIGGHLENIQRRQGFKGFNQKAVSSIIKATDPRGA